MRKELLQIWKSNCEFSRTVWSQDDEASMAEYQDISAYSVMARSIPWRYFYITLQNNVQSLCFTLILTFINSAVEVQISSEELDICLSSSFSQTVSLSEGTCLGNIQRVRSALRMRTKNCHEVASNPCDGTSNSQFRAIFPVLGHLRAGLLIQKGCTHILEKL